MYKTIYVPVDNSDYSNRAIDTAVDLGKKFESKLVGSHVYAAKMHDYIYRDQIELAWDQIDYPDELERFDVLNDSTEIFFRPVKPTDEPALSEMLYSLSPKSIRTRFMMHKKAFPHREVQQFTNIDYRHNVAIIGIVPDASHDQIVALAQYFQDPRSHGAEVALLVQDEWQRKGMGTALLAYITQIAKDRGVKYFYAKVLPNNKPMLTIFSSCGYEVKKTFDGDTYDITYDLTTAERREAHR